MIRVATQKFSYNSLFIFFVALTYLITGCRKTLHVGQEEQVRILEAREDVPPPYGKPSYPREDKKAPYYSFEPTSLPLERAYTKPSLDSVRNSPQTTDKSQYPIKPLYKPTFKKRMLPLPSLSAKSRAKKTSNVIKQPPPLPDINTIPPLTHRIVKGDTLWDIGKSYGVSVRELAAVNGMQKNDILFVGQELIIPPGGKKINKKSKRSVSHSPKKKAHAKKTKKSKKIIAKHPLPSNRKYIVRKGDSLWKISHMFGVSLNNLKALNSIITSDILHPGQVLVLAEGYHVNKNKRHSSRSAKKILPPSSSDNYKNKVPASNSSQHPSEKESDPKHQLDVSIHIPGVNDSPLETTELPFHSENSLLIPHFVLEDNTLESIAEMYGISIKMILGVNKKVKNDDDLKKGMEIQIPLPE